MGWNKKGAEYHYIIISFIIGLLIIGIAMQLIFDFGTEQSDFELCRNSIIVRENIPSGSVSSIFKLKESYPLKCKTDVITIDKKDLANINETINEALIQCWALFGNGDSSLFPGGFGSVSSCVPCARIHLTNEAKQELIRQERRVFLRDIMDDRIEGRDYSFFSYLRDSGNSFPALGLASTDAVNFDSDNFRIEETGIFERVVGLSKFAFSVSTGDFVVEDEYLLNPLNRENGVSTTILKGGELYLPREFYPEKGDLIIAYGVTEFSSDSMFGNHIPYLFYFQQGQKEPDVYTELGKDFLGNKGICDNWEGVPA